ncbi:YXWGXW repeat-containing protein [Robbsia andropogonis]|uniref:YXWGXW repeat-containing protein n=1 Tax=Robbsia andropogonis TaxID=28092 RepID=UPI00209E588A|nr:YXWGXW repeat-containing protein [Robbsia andropogonis]MCP1118913.1 YXWGXW repeat-containing protein [Robbsia andropogonis]MCP1128735.1 YXWGXW repeat-containing protein [Robbsia andropogonis]
MQVLNKLLAAAGVVAVVAVCGNVAAFAQEVIVARPAPPPLRVEVAPPPRVGYAWVRGHWQWDGRAYAWVPGHWRGSPMCPPGTHPGPHGHRCFP